MRRLLDIGFIVFIALACVGLDFYIQKRDAVAASYGLPEYLAQRKGDLDDLLNPPSLSAALPSDIEGWSVQRKGADLMLTGAGQLAADQASEIALVQAITQLTKSGPSAGQMVGMTLTKGDTRLRILAVMLEQPTMSAGAGDGGLGQLIESAATLASAAPYHVVGGVPFAELPVAAVAGDGDLRMLRAALGGAISVNVITKSTDDAAIKEALAKIDFAMLNKLLGSPAPTAPQGGKDSAATTDGAVASQPLEGVLPAPADQTTSGPIATAPVTTALPAPSKTAPAETAVFIAPPDENAAKASAPCVRRAGVLVCPDG